MSSPNDRVITETKRLRLRELQPEDATAMNRIFGDPEVMRFSDGVQDAEWIRNWIEECRERYRQSPPAAPWAVARKTDGDLIGYCGLSRFPDVNGRAETEIGYRLARPYWGHGYATEAACAVRDYAFDTLQLLRLVSLIDPANAASIRVAEKLGMRHEADVMLAGYTHADRVYVVERRVFEGEAVAMQ